VADRSTRELRPHAGAPSGRALALLDEATQLYRGSFLPDDDDVPQIIEHREKLRRRFIRLVIDFGGALEAHAAEGAIAAYENALAIDDQVTPFWLGLMRAHLAAGRPTDAVSAFERGRLSLRGASSSGPNDELRALYDEARTRLRDARAVV